MIEFTAVGDPSRPTLLLLHAMGSDRSFWDHCCVSWESKFRCVAPDLRNAGASPRSERPLLIEDHARDLSELCDHLLLHPVIPVGAAVGAMVATAFAGLYPQRCAGLVLANPGYRTRPDARSSLAARALEVKKNGMGAAVPSAIDVAFTRCAEDARRAAYRRRFLQQDPETYALQIEGMLDANTVSYLPRIGCPTLLVAGGRDLLLPVEHATQLHESIAGSELTVIEDGAHLIPYQRPAEFASLVSAFVERIS